MKQFPSFPALILIMCLFSALLNAQGIKNDPPAALAGGYRFEELNINGRSPGFIYETITPTAMLNGSLYGGTYPHGHIVRIVPTSTTTAITEDLWVVENTDVRYINSLTSVDGYLYGASSINPLLFCFKPGTTEKHYFGQSQLVAEQITFLFDATAYTNQYGTKYLYFTTHNSNSKNELKLVRWLISDNGEPLYFDNMMDIIKISNPDPSRDYFGCSDHIELGTYSDPNDPNWAGTPRKVLYINTGNKMLVIYDLENGRTKIIDNLNIPYDTGNTLKSIASEAGTTNIVWLFTSNNKVIRYNAKDKTYIDYTSSFNGWSISSVRSYPITSGGYIYTHCGKIKTDINSGITFTPYKNSDDTNARIDNMNVNLYNGNLYSAYSYGRNTGIHYEITGVTAAVPSPLKLRLVSPPSVFLQPSGGGIITGLSASNSTVRASYSVGAVEQTYHPDMSAWQLEDINYSQTYNGIGGVQADKIAEKYGHIFYGIYPGPLFRVRAAAGNYDQIIDLKNIINDEVQVRIVGIDFTSDSLMILSTSSSVGAWNTSPCFITFNLKQFLSDKQLTLSKFRKIGYIKSTDPNRILSSIGSVVIRETAGNVTLYGNCFNQLYMQSFTKAELTNITVPKQIMAVSENAGTAYTATILDNSGRLFCFMNTSMYSVPIQSVTQASDMLWTSTLATKYLNYISSTNAWTYCLVKANNGDIFGAASGYLFRFNPSSPGTSPTYYTIPGFSSSNLQMEVYSLAHDPYSGTSVYAGTVSGKIFKLTNEIPTIATGVGDETGKGYSFRLSDNYPNPFNPETRIRYSVGQEGLVSLKVYDMLGREIRTLVNTTQGTGEYEVSFNASDLPSGFYVYQLKSGSNSQTKKMVLVK